MEPLRVCSCHGSLFAYSMLIGITQQQLEDSSLIVEIQSMNLQGGKEVIQEAQDTAVLSYVGFIFSWGHFGKLLPIALDCWRKTEKKHASKR